MDQKLNGSQGTPPAAPAGAEIRALVKGELRTLDKTLQTALGASNLDENTRRHYIDSRDVERYRSIRDVTYSMGLIEDMVMESSPVPSSVAMLISDSTERSAIARGCFPRATRNTPTTRASAASSIGRA
jgi:hypothetical protein